MRERQHPASSPPWYLPAKPGILKFKSRQQIPEAIKSVILNRMPSGKYFAVLTVEGENQTFPKTGQTVGGDLGLVTLLALSDGEKRRPADLTGRLPVRSGFGSENFPAGTGLRGVPSLGFSIKGCLFSASGHT